jgi:hypothetical protein
MLAQPRFRGTKAGSDHAGRNPQPLGDGGC